MATRGMTEFTVNGTDYTVNDPNIAPEFDESAVIAAGSYVNYEGVLYLIGADHAAGVTWANTTKTPVLVGGMLKQLSEMPTAGCVTTQVSRAVQIRTGDLNGYTTPGNYYVRDSGDVPNIQNMPDNEPGRLIVLHTATVNNIQQIFVTTAGYVYFRMKNAVGWSSWVRMSFKTDFANCVQLYASAYTHIPINSDLDDYTTPGEYAIATSTIARATANIPDSSPGKLIVMQTATANNLTQIYMTDANYMYMRIRSGSGWGEWKNVIAKTREEKRIENAAVTGLNNRLKALMNSVSYNIAFANAPAPLSFKNYLGNTQNIHPKVLYFSGKFGGHFFWMAYTPYPNGNDDYENPCVAYSDDGYNWTNIAENPLDSPSSNYYNSDTHLVYREDTGKLECWFRAVVTVTGGRTEKIYRRTTTDGVTWTAKELVYETGGLSAARILSPTVIWDGTNYNIWVVDNGVITFYTAPGINVSDWTLVRRYTMTFTDGGVSVNPWHLDVIQDGANYLMVVMTMNGDATGKNRKYSLFATTSQDNITYDTPQIILQGSNNWDNLLYRSSVVKIGSVYWVYYSGIDYYDTFGMAIAQGTAINRLIGVYT